MEKEGFIKETLNELIGEGWENNKGSQVFEFTLDTIILLLGESYNNVREGTKQDVLKLINIQKSGKTRENKRIGHGQALNGLSPSSNLYRCCGDIKEVDLKLLEYSADLEEVKLIYGCPLCKRELRVIIKDIEEVDLMELFKELKGGLTE